MKIRLIEDFGVLIVRLMAGGLILTHGIPKISRLFGEGPIKFADPFGLGPEITLTVAVFAEVVCAVLIMIGYKTRLATIPLMITVLTAALYAHWDDPFAKKELPLLFFAVFLAILMLGGKKFSLDNLKKFK